MTIRRLLIIGLVVRLLMSPFFAHPFDMYSWFSNGEDFLRGVAPLSYFLAPYRYAFFLFVFPASSATAFYPMSPPFGSEQVSSLSPDLARLIPAGVLVIPGLFFDAVLKMPLIMSDLIVGFVVYRIALEGGLSRKLALASASQWLFNPLVVWVSSGWGMFDALPALFSVLSLYCVLVRRPTLAALCLVTAVALKLYAIVLIVPFFLVLKSTNQRMRVPLVAISAGLALLLLPTILGYTSYGIGNVVHQNTNGLVYSGLSIWTPFTLFANNFPTAFVSLTVTSVLILSSYWLLSLRLKKADFQNILLAYTLPLIPLLLGFEYVAENYFVWAIPTASILILSTRVGRIAFWMESFINFVSSVTNSLLPYYMLPLAYWIGPWLVATLGMLHPLQLGAAGTIPAGVSIGKLYLAGLAIISAFMLSLMSLAWLVSDSKLGRKVEDIFGILLSHRNLLSSASTSASILCKRSSSQVVVKGAKVHRVVGFQCNRLSKRSANKFWPTRNR